MKSEELWAPPEDAVPPEVLEKIRAKLEEIGPVRLALMMFIAEQYFKELDEVETRV